MPDFAAWSPDVYPFQTDVASEASGVLVKANAYTPLPQPAPPTSITANTAIRGAFAARLTDNSLRIFALSATNAYKFNGPTNPWLDITRLSGGTYNLAPDDYWSICQYGTNLIAANINDTVQTIDVNSGANLVPLGGSPPNGAYVEVVGDFVELGNTALNSSSVKWSGRNDSATWTAYVKDSDSQPFPEGGYVTGIAGFELGGLVWQADYVRVQMVETSSAIFSFHMISAAHGTLSPSSIVKEGADVYYYSTAGFMRISGLGQGAITSIVNVGSNRVNDWFNSDRNKTRPKAIIGALDPLVRRIFWLYPRSSNASSVVLDGLIIYDIERDRWTHASCALTYIFSAATSGMTLGQLSAVYPTLTAVPYPFGSDAWKGGAPGLAAFNANNQLCFFSGTPMAATVQTSPFQPTPGARSLVKGFRLNGDAATATGRAGGTETPTVPVNWKKSAPVGIRGDIPCRISTRFVQIEVDVPQGAAWTALAGVDFDPDHVIKEGDR